jgi:hypothetical protein
MPTQTHRHTCSENLGIFKILRYIRSGMCTASATNSKLLYITQSPNPPNTVLHRSHDEIVKLDKKRTDGHYSQHHVIKSKHHLMQWFLTFSPNGPLLLFYFWGEPRNHLMKKLILFLLINKFRDCIIEIVNVYALFEIKLI